RDELYHGVTSAFRNSPDYHIALLARTCRFAAAASGGAGRRSNRVYTFGRSGLTVIDGAAFEEQLSERILSDLANYLTGKRKEKRWRDADYAQRFQDLLEKHRVIGRVMAERRILELPEDQQRLVRVTIGLDDVREADARAYFRQANAAFKEFGVRFDIQHIYAHPLDEGWNWPNEIKKMQDKSDSDIYVLLTPAAWISQDSGHVLGLGSTFFGAVMVQASSQERTRQRLLHELGHLFGLRHTFLEGHIMYPTESGIGLSWSPGSTRSMEENKLTATWHSVQTYRQRFDIAVRLAPPMMHRAKIGAVPLSAQATGGRDRGINCSA
ncbi:MAG: hypothetical protein KKB37_07585, partial [Alphaproteobacteria bacterium]|nr:hypothetical protein [Alphaproteobacteria bacterium]